MPRKKHKLEEIVAKLRQVDVIAGRPQRSDPVDWCERSELSPLAQRVRRHLLPDGR